MGKKTSKKLFLDESRMWNMEQPIDESIGSMLRGTTRSILLGYFWKDAKAESLLNISGSSKDLSTISIKKKIITLENEVYLFTRKEKILNLFIVILQIIGPFCVQL